MSVNTLAFSIYFCAYIETSSLFRILYTTYLLLKQSYKSLKIYLIRKLHSHPDLFYCQFYLQAPIHSLSLRDSCIRLSVLQRQRQVHSNHFFKEIARNATINQNGSSTEILNGSHRKKKHSLSQKLNLLQVLCHRENQLRG